VSLPDSAYPFIRPANDERCGACGEVGERVRSTLPEYELGEMFTCSDCNAIHVVVADGLKFTGVFDTEDS
jgi:hypothetical protein